MVTSGNAIVLADAADAAFADGSSVLTGATLYLKQEMDPGVLCGLGFAAAPAAGRNGVTVTAKTWQRLDADHVEAGDVSLTSCDCRVGDPDFRLTAPTATLSEEVAVLHAPRLWLGALALPLVVPLPVPLTDRKSGLLFPKIMPWGSSGFGVDEPFFLTLGESADLTFDAGIFTGRDPASIPGQRGVKGPLAGLEFRYAPTSGASGKITVSDLIDSEPSGGPRRGFRGQRLAGTLLHRSLLPLGGHFAIDAKIVGDSSYYTDTTADLLQRAFPYGRSDGAAEWSGENAVASVGATAFQDLRAPDQILLGSSAPPTFQHLPSAQIAWPVVPIGDAAASFSVRVDRFATWSGAGGGEDRTGFAPADSCFSGCSIPAATAFAPTSRAGLWRADSAPRLLVPLALDRFAVLTPEIGARADAYHFDDLGRDRARVYVWTGTRLTTEVARTFESGLRHTIRPSVSWRILSPAFTTGGPPIGDPFDAGGAVYRARPTMSAQGVPRDLNAGIDGVPAARRAYDEIDGAAPEAGLHQIEARVVTELSAATSEGPWQQLLQLEVGQGARLGATAVSMAPSGLAESWARLSAALPSARSTIIAQARYAWQRPARGLSLGSLAWTTADARGDEVHAAGTFLAAGAGDTLRAGIDELFAAAPVPQAFSSGAPLKTVGIGGRVTVPAWMREGWSLRYQGTFFFSADRASDVAQHDAGLSYDSPCHCVTIGVGLTLLSQASGLSVAGGSLVLDLKQLGSLSGAR